MLLKLLPSRWRLYCCMNLNLDLVWRRFHRFVLFCVGQGLRELIYGSFLLIEFAPASASFERAR